MKPQNKLWVARVEHKHHTSAHHNGCEICSNNGRRLKKSARPRPKPAEE